MKKALTVLLFISVSIISFSQIKVACIGNSITYGSRINDRSKTYPAKLDNILGENWDVKNFGVSGATMLKKGNNPYWETDKYSEMLSFKPDVAIIKLGTNDSKTFNWSKYKKEYKKNYYAFIDTLRSVNPNINIWLCLPVPVLEEKYSIDKKTVEGTITRKIKRVSKKKNTGLINLYSIFENKPHLLPDKIHPNADGAQLIAEEVAKVIKKNENKILKK